AGRHRERRPLLSGDAEGRGDRSRRRGRPHRVPRHRARELHPPLQGARPRLPAAVAAGVRSLPDLRQGPERSHHRAQLLRPEGGHGLGRRGLLEDAPGDRRHAGMTEARPARPGFAGVDYDEAMRRARGLVPALRERAAAAEAGREMPKETIEDLHRTGLFRFHQPRRWGGMELDFVALFDVPAEVARGCASTGWNVANLSVHHWMLALYDERAQDEVWSKNPDALIASGIAYPQGGGDACDWNMLAVMVRDGERVVDHRLCLVPRSEYEIVDDWNVLGMRSTGSKSVRAREVFVPEHRALCMYLARGGNHFPGARANPNPLYQVPLSALGSHCLAAGGGGHRHPPGRARADRRRGPRAQHQLHRRAHARLPGRSAARRPRRRDGR